MRFGPGEQTHSDHAASPSTAETPGHPAIASARASGDTPLAIAHHARLRGRARRLGLLAVYLLFAFLFLRDFEDPRELFCWLNPAFNAYSLFRTAVFLATALGMVAVLVVLFLCRWSPIRWLTALFLAVTLALHLSYKHHVNGEGFYLHDAAIIVTGWETAADAISVYAAKFLPVLGVSVIVALGLCFVATKALGTVRSRWSAAVLPAMLAGAVFVWHAQGRHCFFPIPFRIPALLSAQLLLVYNGPREKPRLQPAGDPQVDAIVVIIDESILATHLSINGYGRNTTPFLQNRRNELANLGIASAAGNASLTSIGVLLSGIRPDQLPDKSYRRRRFPTVFQYATGVGFRGYYVRGQYYAGLLGNVQDACPAGMFEIVAAADGVERPFVDRVAADAIIRCLGGAGKVLVVTQKIGAHFAYERRYPQDRKPFSPTLEGPEWSDDWGKSTNSYDNCVRWACDEYFEYLLPRIENLGRDVVVIYTSDHGQVLPGTIPGLCETSAFIENYSESACVPLFVWGTGPRGKSVVRRINATSGTHDRCSHFEVFPTLLVLLGYSQRGVRDEYGYSLMDIIPEGRRREYLAGLIGCPTARMQEFRPADVRNPRVPGGPSGHGDGSLVK